MNNIILITNVIYPGSRGGLPSNVYIEISTDNKETFTPYILEISMRQFISIKSLTDNITNKLDVENILKRSAKRAYYINALVLDTFN